ncbi:helix-turn-helix domain-containing protein [Flavobacteriaceae bacterium W22]|nr:helix-turn-helix domain-containing protein [Flavobacteriaceae bacterium W22]
MKVNSTRFPIKKCLEIILLTALFFMLFSFNKVPTIDDIDRRIKSSEHRRTLSIDKSIKIALECYKDSKKIKYNKGIIRSGSCLIISYIGKFDYDNAIKLANEIESYVLEYGNDQDVYLFHRSKGQCLVDIGLPKEGYNEYLKANNAIEKFPESDEKYYKKSTMYLYIANYHTNSVTANEDSVIHYTKKALQEAEKISDKSRLSKTGIKNDWLISLNFNLGQSYLTSKPSDINSSRVYYEKARNLYETSKTKLLPGNEIQILSYLCLFYYNDKNYKESIRFGLKSLEIQKKKNDPFSRRIAFEHIAKSYSELGKQEEYEKYINKYIALNDSIEISERNKKTVSLEKVLKKKEDDNAKKHNLVLYVSGATILIIALCFLFLWKHRNKKIHSNYLAIIESIKNEKEIKSLDTELASDEKVNTFNIPEETYHKIIKKMDRFEKNLGFLKNDITLSYLSSQFKTNPKSLSAVIKSSTNKNFNNYINDLRINYIIHKLYENKQYREFKINYLAEESGFSSPKVFVTAFKKLTGVTPSYYITNLKKNMS